VNDDAMAPVLYDYLPMTAKRSGRWKRTLSSTRPLAPHVELQEGSPDTLLLPMLVRGDLLGFIACGAKIDRTAFLDDEIMPLAQLAHRIGLAQVTLAPGRAQRLSVQSTSLRRLLFIVRFHKPALSSAGGEPSRTRERFCG
jgi:hypothetical protein